MTYKGQTYNGHGLTIITGPHANINTEGERMNIPMNDTTHISFIETKASWGARVNPELNTIQIRAYWWSEQSHRYYHFMELVENETLRKNLSSDDRSHFESAFAAYGDVMKNGKTYDHGRDRL